MCTYLRAIFCKTEANLGQVRKWCLQNTFTFSYVVPNNEFWKMVKFFWKSSVVHKLFVLKDWYILGKNMHLKSDCIFKGVFGLKYSLRNSLSIWYDKSVLRIIWKIWIQRFLIFQCLEIIAQNLKNISFGPNLSPNIFSGLH